MIGFSRQRNDRFCRPCRHYHHTETKAHHPRYRSERLDHLYQLYTTKRFLALADLKRSTPRYQRCTRGSKRVKCRGVARHTKPKIQNKETHAKTSTHPTVVKQHPTTKYQYNLARIPACYKLMIHLPVFSQKMRWVLLLHTLYRTHGTPSGVASPQQIPAVFVLVLPYLKATKTHPQPSQQGTITSTLWTRTYSSIQ